MSTTKHKRYITAELKRTTLRGSEVKTFLAMFEAIAKNKGSAEKARCFCGVLDSSIHSKMKRGELSTISAKKILTAYKKFKSQKGAENVS